MSVPFYDHISPLNSIGLTLEQVDELFETVDKAWKSREFVPTMRYVDIAGKDKTSGPGSTSALDEDTKSQGDSEQSTGHIEIIA